MRIHHTALWKDVLRLLVLIGVGIHAPASAQNRPSASFDFTSGAVNPLDILRQRMAQSASTSASLPLEGAVDPATYIVGPGDLFSVSINGSEVARGAISVTADGYLVLPEAGTVSVAGLPLETARQRALDVLKPQFQNVQVNVNLTQPRQFYVHVSGAVPVPGRHLVMPVARVADVLEWAFADTTRLAVANADYRPSLRNVTLTRQDSTEHSLDLLRYFATGNTQHNPYLRDGDVVFVPAYDPNFSSVYVDGAVPFPGAYDFRPDDTVLDLLTLATGDPALRAVKRVRLARQHESGALDTTFFDVQAMVRGAAPAPALQPRDHVSVVQETLPGGVAAVEGFVRYPGTYPILQGRTTLSDLLARAGGVRPEASLRRAYLERQTLPDPTARPTMQNRFEPGPNRYEFLPIDTLEIMQNLRMSDLDFFSRAYFAQEMRLQNRVSVDLEAVLSPGATPIYLHDGDKLVVPRDNQTVFVFGQIVRPGYIAYVPGRNADYYINAAGGRGPLSAPDAYIVDAGTGQYFTANDAMIQSGDMIFLDRRRDLADSPDMQRLALEESRARADARIRSMQTLLQAIGSIAGVVTVIVTLSRN